jgi:uncharacterized membrane protein
VVICKAPIALDMALAAAFENGGTAKLAYYVCFLAIITVALGSFGVAANAGLHYAQAGNYAAARTWFERSLRLERKSNPIASSYLPIVTSRLLEAATNEFSAGLRSASP